AWRPAFLGYPDAVSYIDAARLRGLGLVFWNQYRPAGYPLFLSSLHGIRADLTSVIVLQHAMGLLAASLLYLNGCPVCAQPVGRGAASGGGRPVRQRALPRARSTLRNALCALSGRRAVVRRAFDWQSRSTRS